MKGVIETLKFTDSNGEKYNLYPRTLIECISNQNGDSLEDTLQQYVDTQFSDTYADKTYVAEQIAASNHLIREIVTEIPTAETAKDNVIYMYKVDSATGSDVYQEYQLIGGEVVLVGDTSVDLSNYVQSEELDEYLKVTGGKTTGSLYVRDSSTTQFVVEHTNGNTPQIAFNGTDGRLGSVLYDAKNGSLKRINGDTTSSYIILDSGNYSDYALPKTGGEVLSASDVVFSIGSTHINKRVMLKFLNNGTNYGYLGFTEANKPVYATDTGTLNDLLHSANVGNYALPIGGGSITSANGTPLDINVTASDAITSFIKYTADGTELGRMGFHGAGKPMVRMTDSNYYDILHTGNKPTGTYTGTGSTTRNPINIGGIGKTLVILSDNGMVIVTALGAICKAKNGSDVIGLPRDEVCFQDGTFATETDNAYINANGVIYTYELL